MNHQMNTADVLFLVKSAHVIISTRQTLTFFRNSYKCLGIGKLSPNDDISNDDDNSYVSVSGFSVIQYEKPILCQFVLVDKEYHCVLHTMLSVFQMFLVVIRSNIHTSANDRRDYFEFPIVNFAWLSGDVPRLPSYGVYILQLVRFARCRTSVFDFHYKIFKSLQNYCQRVTDIKSFENRLESSFGHRLNFCPNLVQDCLKKMLQKGFTHDHII